MLGALLGNAPINSIATKPRRITDIFAICEFARPQILYSRDKVPSSQDIANDASAKRNGRAQIH